MDYNKIKQEKFPIGDIKRNLITKVHNQTPRYILIDISMNKGEQRRLYSSQLQKIMQKNIKNKISFSINNYNNNNTHSESNLEDVYTNLNQNRFHDGIQGLNKSLDLSRNKSACYPLKPSYIIKNENPTDQNVNYSNFEYNHNNKSNEYENKNIDDFNNFNYKSRNINNIIENSSNYGLTEDIFLSKSTSKNKIYFNFL
jgi:hypothetical protein